MQSSEQIEKPVRVGVFGTIERAQRAVESLVRSGFARDDISVIAPESIGRRFFGDLAEATESKRSAEGAATGGAIGALLGGLGLVAGVATAGGIPVLAAGALGVGFGGVVGGLVGAMSMRGVEKEYAHYYDQSITKGKILVAVESHDPSRLTLAERLIAEAGAEPVALPEG